MDPQINEFVEAVENRDAKRTVEAVRSFDRPTDVVIGWNLLTRLSFEFALECHQSGCGEILIETVGNKEKLISLDEYWKHCSNRESYPYQRQKTTNSLDFGDHPAEIPWKDVILK